MSDVKHIKEVVQNFEKSLQEMLGGKVSVIWVPENQLNDLDALKTIIYTVTLITWEQIKKKNRRQGIVEARHLFCWFAHYKFGKNKSDLMRIMGIDHTTVIHGIKKVNDLLEAKDVVITEHFSKITSMVNSYEESKIKGEQFAVAGAGQ